MLLNVMPIKLMEHLEKDCAVSDAVAEPGLAGLVLTVALTLPALQVSCSDPSEKTADVPVARPEVSTAPILAAVPPVLLIVSTLVAAYADAAGSTTTAADAATAAR